MRAARISKSGTVRAMKIYTRGEERIRKIDTEGADGRTGFENKSAEMFRDARRWFRGEIHAIPVQRNNGLSTDSRSRDTPLLKRRCRNCETRDGTFFTSLAAAEIRRVIACTSHLARFPRVREISPARNFGRNITRRRDAAPRARERRDKPGGGRRLIKRLITTLINVARTGA